MKKNKALIYKQILISIAIIAIVSFICLFFRENLGYQITAIIFLATVSLLAIQFDIVPVLISSVLSGMALNFLFIPPYYTLHIENSNDILLFSIYLAVALVSSVLSAKIRKEERKSRLREEQKNSIKLFNTLLNSLSHELRTPISAIVASVDGLRDQQDHGSDATREELLEQIDIACQRLNRQVENLLSMSRFESGLLRPKYEWTDINDLIYSTIRKLPEHHQKIQFDSTADLPLCLTDGGILEQILQNLLINAITHTPPHSKVEITCDWKNEQLFLTVEDDGPGVAEDQLNEIFQKFYKLPQAGPVGTGLGLSIVRAFTEALRGYVIAENRNEGGLRIRLNIPMEASYMNQLNYE